MNSSDTRLHPRRSALFMPGSNDRALTKARSLPADCIIIDLEDAVSPDDKQLARDTAVSHLREGGFGKRERIVRINDSSEFLVRQILQRLQNSKAMRCRMRYYCQK